MSVWAVLVAAGTGTRFGGLKQFEQLGDRSVLDWSLDACRASCDAVVAVLPASEAHREVRADAVAAGGPSRSGSVRAGMELVPLSAEVIVVHDAARPLARPELFDAVIGAVRAGADAAVPCVPLADTVKRVTDGRVVETLAREELAIVQTPQAFRAKALREAHEDGRDATDDAALVERAGGTVAVVGGDATNIKLTSADDLAVARALSSRWRTE